MFMLIPIIINEETKIKFIVKKKYLTDCNTGHIMMSGYMSVMEHISTFDAYQVSPGEWVCLSR